MTELEWEIRRRYLDSLDDGRWEDSDPALDYGSRALPCFVEAFGRETDPARRSRLVRVIWQFRDPAALPALTVALRDSHDEVWKDALDGFVTLASEQALAILRQERIALAADSNGSEKLSWIDEAIGQILDEIKRKNASKPGAS